MSDLATKKDLRQFRGQLEQDLLGLLEQQGKIYYNEEGRKLIEAQIIKTALAAGVTFEDWTDEL